MAPHSNTFAWRIPWTEEPGGLQSMGLLELDTTERLHFDFSLSCIGEGNGNPLQHIELPGYIFIGHTLSEILESGLQPYNASHQGKLWPLDKELLPT